MPNVTKFSWPLVITILKQLRSLRNSSLSSFSTPWICCAFYASSCSSSRRAPRVAVRLPRLQDSRLEAYRPVAFHLLVRILVSASVSCLLDFLAFFEVESSISASVCFGGGCTVMLSAMFAQFLTAVSPELNVGCWLLCAASFTVG